MYLFYYTEFVKWSVLRGVLSQQWCECVWWWKCDRSLVRGPSAVLSLRALRLVYYELLFDWLKDWRHRSSLQPEDVQANATAMKLHLDWCEYLLWCIDFSPKNFCVHVGETSRVQRGFQSLGHRNKHRFVQVPMFQLALSAAILFRLDIQGCDPVEGIQKVSPV